MAIFTTSNVPISSLIEDIDMGKIGLPELQRPFVWPNVNVRDLFDSLYRGYPAGFLLFGRLVLRAARRASALAPSSPSLNWQSSMASSALPLSMLS